MTRLGAIVTISSHYFIKILISHLSQNIVTLPPHFIKILSIIIYLNKYLTQTYKKNKITIKEIKDPLHFKHKLDNLLTLFLLFFLMSHVNGGVEHGHHKVTSNTNVEQPNTLLSFCLIENNCIFYLIAILTLLVFFFINSFNSTHLF